MNYYGRLALVVSAGAVWSSIVGVISGAILGFSWNLVGDDRYPVNILSVLAFGAVSTALTTLVCSPIIACNKQIGATQAV